MPQNYRANSYSSQKTRGLLDALLGQGGPTIGSPIADTASAAFGPAGGDFVRGAGQGAGDAMLRNAGPLPLMDADPAGANMERGFYAQAGAQPFGKAAGMTQQGGNGMDIGGQQYSPVPMPYAQTPASVESENRGLLGMIADPPDDATEDNIGHFGLFEAVGDNVAERGLLGMLSDTAGDMAQGFRNFDQHTLNPLRRKAGIPFKPVTETPEPSAAGLAQAVGNLPMATANPWSSTGYTQAHSERRAAEMQQYQSYLDALSQVEGQTRAIGGRR